MKTSNTTIQSPEEAKIISLRDCFREINNRKFLALLFISSCILLARTTNLNKAADFAPKAGSKALPSSNHVRLLRFFATGVGEAIHRGVLRAVLRLALRSGKGLCLVMDRTDWKHGAGWRNLLVVGLCFEGYLVPLVWTDLSQRGNSSPQMRLALLEKLAAWWPHDELPLKSFPLVADREFGGEGWLLKLARLGFHFVVRIKSNRQLSVWLDGTMRHKAATLRALRRYLARREQNSTEVVIAGEYICHLVCLPNTGTRDPDPYFYLLTNLDLPSQAGGMYQRRYFIECCFKHLKSNGFDLEKQGFDLPHQVEIITALLVLLYTVCVVCGVIQQQAVIQAGKKPKMKEYKDGSVYLARSLFRQGLTRATALVGLPVCLLNFVNELLNWFSIIYDG